MNFSQLLSPQLSAEQFFDTHWEKRPFHLPRGDPSYYACLFNVTSDLEGLLHNAHHRVYRWEQGPQIWCHERATECTVGSKAP